MKMNTRVLFFIRLLVIFGLALVLIAAVPASASNLGSLKNPASPPGWLAFRPPSFNTMAIVVDPVGDTTTDETGDTATISIHLDSEPSANVTIPVSSTDPTEGTVTPDQLVFTPINYASPQDITVTGVNDDVDDGNIIYTIQLGPATSTDLAYDGVDPADIDLTNTDNDTANVTVTPTSGLTTTEANGDVEPTFTVALTSQPTADVIIGVSSSNPAEGTVAPTSLTFTTANWATSKTVTVTGVDDLIDDGNIDYTIQTTNPTGDDATYNAINPADVAVTNVDNDIAGITVSAISGPTTEAAGTATFTVVLNTKPTGNVTIGLSSSNVNEGTVLPASLVFNGGNWDSSPACHRHRRG